MPSTTFNQKSFIISFGIGISIYLIYIHSSISTQNSVNFNYYPNFTIPEFRTPKSDILKIISTPECGRFPLMINLNVTDTYWQVTKTKNGTFYLYNAYFDDREDVINGSVIRILALINRIDPVVKTYCQMWFEGFSNAIPVDVQEYKLIWPKYWGQNEKGASPYLITCLNPIMNESLVPKFVSLVEENCGYANNVMEVKNRKTKNGFKEKFLISVKGLDFLDDVSMLLIEWCEFLKVFGVAKVEIFVVNAHPNVLNVLKFYENQGLVTIKFLKYPSELPNKASQSWHQWTQNDLIPYHDSFYENLYLYEYMIPMDIDEFIVPKNTQDRTWSDLLKRTIEKSRIKNETFDAFPVSNMYFLLKSVHENETIDGIPKNLRFLSNIYRAANFTPNGGNAKTFMRMDKIFTVHNHFPFSCLNASYCKLFDVQQEDGQMAHYRIDCDNPECKAAKTNPVKDVTLWKYKDEVLKAVNNTLKELKGFKSDVEWIETNSTTMVENG